MAHHERADLIIRDACIVDGSGDPSFEGDVSIRHGRIVEVGTVSHQEASIEIDAAGRVVSPGFIDAHTHDDRALLVDPLMRCKVSQGVTSVVTGNCGVSLAPLVIDRRPPAPLDLVGPSGDAFHATFAQYLDALDASPAAVNSVSQVGHSTLRVAHVADLDRPADDREIAHMRAALEQSLDAGASGFSTGLFYAPARAASTEEVTEIARGLVPFGGVHTTHMRDEGPHIEQSLAETFRIGRDAEVPVVISHLKCSGAPNFGRSTAALALIDEARTSQSIAFDVYPYAAGSTSLGSGRRLDSLRTTISWSEPHPEFAGRDLDEVAAELGLDVEAAVEELSPAGGIFFAMDEADVRRILADPHSMIGSDGLPHDVHPHPRLWGTFPRVLGHYARDLGLFTLEDAVRKMTARTASRFGMELRGSVAVDHHADIVLFDAATIIDEATYDHPDRPASGVDLVVVNGEIVYRDGEHTGARPGRSLRRSA